MVNCVEVRKLESLHWINGQISRTQNSLYVLNVQLEEKRRELERLALAYSNLHDFQDEFRRNEQWCLAPELSEDTWTGTLANQFQQWKENEILQSYVALYNKQLALTMDQLNDKLRETKQSIIDIRMDVTAQNNALDDLYDRQRRELMN
jgi:hypothetical protein